MRWKYVVPRALVMAALWGFFAFGFDPLLTRETVSLGESAVSAKVDVSAIKTSFFPPGISVAGVRIANHAKPGTNLLEFDSLEMKLHTGALAKKSLVVEKGTISGLRWGTPREDSGLLPEPPAKAAAPKKSAAEEVAPSASLTDKTEEEMVARGKSLFSGLADKAKLQLDPNQFESVRVGTELEKQWTATFKDFEARGNDLQKQVDAIKQNVQSGSGNKLERLDAYRNAAGESTRLLQELKQLKTDIDSHSQDAKAAFAALQQAKEHDLTKIHDEADLFKMDPEQLTEYLLGPELHQRLNELVDWTKWAKSHYTNATREPAPVRMRGEEVLFAKKPEFPRFLIKLLGVSGEGQLHDQPLKFTGTISGLTSNPVLYGQPVVMRLKGNGAADLDLKVVFDYTQADAEPVHQVSLSYAVANPSPMQLGDEGSLAVTVAADKLACRAELKLIGESLTGTLKFRQEPVHMTASLKNANAQVEEHVTTALADIFGGINALSADLQIDGQLTAPHWSVQSDLGQQIASGMNTAFAHQLDEVRQDLAGKLDQTIAQQSGKLQDLFKQKMQGLTSQLNGNQQDVQQLVQQVAGGRLAELDKATGGRLGAVKGASGIEVPTSPDDLKKTEDDIKGGLKKLFKK